MLFKEGAKLQIAVLSDLIFLTPDYTRSNAGLSLDSQPRTDTSVEGTVTLSLPTAKKLSRLLVQLVTALTRSTISASKITDLLDILPMP